MKNNHRLHLLANYNLDLRKSGIDCQVGDFTRVDWETFNGLINQNPTYLIWSEWGRGTFALVDISKFSLLDKGMMCQFAEYAVVNGHMYVLEELPDTYRSRRRDVYGF